MSRTLVNPRLNDKLENINTHTCTIQNFTTVKNSIGEDIKTWANLASHIDLKCFKGNDRGGELLLDDKTQRISNEVINLLGEYPLIKQQYRVIADSVTYNILSVDFDPSKNMTRLTIEVVLV